LTVYSVLSEFQFETAEALAKSEALHAQLEKVAGAADAVNQGLQSAAWSLLGQVGLYGGIAGAIWGAIKAADKYEKSQRSIANIFLSNKMYDGPRAFEDSMVASAAAMENMKNAARQFSLPVSDLVGTAKGIAAVLVNHGLDDSSLSTSTKMARGLLKSAPVLGIDPSLAQGQLTNMIMGRAMMNDTLAMRLMNETTAMRPFAPAGGGHRTSGGGFARFNMLKPEERVKVLTESLMQFGSNTKIVDENAKSLSQQMQRLGDNMIGMFSILRPIGKAILDPLKKAMLTLNIWLESHGEAISKKIGSVLKDALEDPVALYAQIQQLRHLRRDVHRAGDLVLYTGIIHAITGALHFLGIELKGGLLMAGLRLLGSVLRFVGGYLFSFQALRYALMALRYVMVDILAPMAVFTSMFQGISRGVAEAQADYVKWFADNATAIASTVIRWKDIFAKIFAPIAMIADGFAYLTRIFMSHTVAADFLLAALNYIAPAFDFIGDVIVHCLAELGGAVNAFLGIFNQIALGNWRHMFDNMKQDAKEGYHAIWDKYHKNAEIDNSATSKQVTNINTVNINNAFKEQMEPDRIAFSLKDQLLKAAANPLQASGRSMAGRAAVN
jgi:hypothetical protein